jgi:hypothetical protein
MDRKLQILLGIIIVIVVAAAGVYLYTTAPPPTRATSIVVGFNITGPVTLGTPLATTANLSGYVAGSPMNKTNALITFYWSTDNSTWTLLDTENVPSSGGIVSVAVPPLVAGTYYFKANYTPGSSRYLSNESATASITINKASSSTSTLLNATTIVLGASVSDTAYVSFSIVAGLLPLPSGTITFDYRLGSEGAWQSLGTAFYAWNSTSQQRIAVSLPFTPLQVGIYQFNATYNGDGNYFGSWPSTITTLEVVNVSASTPNMTINLISTNITLGQSDRVHVAVMGLMGSFPLPTGQIQFMNNNTGVWVTFDVENLTGGVATSSYFTPTQTGTAFFMATYGGDGNYNAVTSDVVTLSVNPNMTFIPFMVSGYVNAWNGNGLSGWAVNLYNATALVASSTTGSGGYYSFTINQSAIYSINETVQSGWLRISPADDYSFNAASGHASMTGLNFTNFQYAVVPSGIKGNPLLGGLSLATNSSVNIPTGTISVTAGSLNVSAVDGVPVSDEGLVIIFAYNGTNLVTFSGAQFDLFLSQDGFASINPGDIPYAIGFNVSSFSDPFPTAIQISDPFLPNGSATFYMGTRTVNGVSAEMIMGPIPLNITQDYRYIKVYDGGIVVALQQVIVEPSLRLTPTSGPAGTAATIEGNALLPDTQYNLTYGNSSTAFAQVTTDGIGSFSLPFNMRDTGANWAVTPITHIEIDLLNTNGSFVTNSFFSEPSRVFLELAGNVGTFGNGTGPYNVTCLSNYTFVGNSFNPTGPVVFTIDGSKALGTTTANATGFFNATFTIPALTGGIHNVTVTNVLTTANFTFSINVLPSLVLSPTQGGVGTRVTVQTYGFAPGPIYFYFGQLFPNSTYSYYWILNSTVGSNGQINGTNTFIVPSMAGGNHTVYADYIFDGNYTNSLTSEVTSDIIQIYL